MEVGVKGSLLEKMFQATVLFTLIFIQTLTFAAVDDATSLRDGDAIDLTTFDHLATGFALDGNHSIIDCESCHVGGVFEGLPTTCESCHDSVFAVGKDSTHIPTVENCDVCHSPLGFESSAATTIMDHSSIGAIPCSSCHDNVTATGKNPTHITTTGECDACHSTNSWLTSGFDHSTIGSQACFECHDGVQATGKTSTHITTSNLCEACHSTTVWIPVIGVDHSQVVGDCVDCHNGEVTSGKITNHMPTTNECGACHTTTAWFPILNSGVDHSQVVGPCEDCHNGGFSQGKGVNHVPTTAACDTCHVTTTWTIGAFDHANVAGQACFDCHNNTVTPGKTPTHFDTSDTCDACHNTTQWIPVDPLVDHAHVNGTCESCHNNQDAIGKGPNHVVTTLSCDSCHVTTTWQISTFDHSLTTDACITCHDGAQATGKSAAHIDTSDLCEACHVDTTWVVANNAVDHNEVNGSCVSCHDGTIASGKNVNHISTSDNCELCHAPGPTPWTPVDNANVDHTQVLGTCVSCHDGTIASGKSANHINTTDACDSCHATNPTPWSPVPQGGVDHAEVLGVCSACHDNIIATGKGPTHITTNDECNICHSTQQWVPAAVDHTNFVAGQCVTCHDGVQASGKGPTHINSSDVCDSCHERFPSLWTPVAPAAVNHNDVIGTCFSCHDAIIASGKSPNHITSSNTCDACHEVAPTPWAPVAPANVDHTQVTGTCISCHDGLTASGKSTAHINSSDQCDSCHEVGPTPWTPVAPAAVDHTQVIGTCISCHDGVIASGKGVAHINTSDSCDACHAEGPTPWSPVANANVDHAHVIGTCISCHNGTTASGKGASHINSSDACDACHQVGPTPWTPVANSSVDHNEVIGACSTCHDNVIAQGQGPTHIPTTNECDSCHNTASWLTVVVDHTDFVAGDCVSCHDGTNATGKGPTHINTSDICDACHERFPALWTPVQNASVDHAHVVGTCASCHDGIIASGKSVNHINTTDVCDACHQPGPALWTPVPQGGVDHAEVLGVCSACHDNVIAVGKGPTHVTTTEECDVCHSTQQWVPAAVDHSGFVAGECSTCHDGVQASGKDANHINSSDICDACHERFPAFWTPVANAAVDHTQVIGTCVSCHDGTVASGKSPSHINSSDTCDACHAVAPTPWTPVAVANVDHAHVLGTCVSCHDGVVASGKTATHINTSDNCDACHAVGPTPWMPVAVASVDHNEVIGTCASCHDGTTASGKGPNHINSSDVCDACHLVHPTPWAPVANSAVDHNQVLGVCSSCHDNVIATGKGPTHVTTVEECDVCHSTQQWTPAAVDHTTLLPDSCITCHDGVLASGKGVAHINTSDFCDSCHQRFPATWTPVANNAVDHSEVIGTCISCHNGTTASGKSANHINTSDVCDACHQPGPTPWTPVANSNVNHDEVLGVCSSCHDNIVAQGKGPTHVQTTAECDICHTVGAWVPALTGGTPDHSTFTNNCATCHDGVTASGKIPTHINSSDQCDSCHAVHPATWAPVANNAVDHSQVIGTCASCHNGTIASGKGPTHIASTDFCDACHLPGPTPWTPVANSAVDHNQVLGVCSSCHDNVTATGKGPTHVTTTEECDICHSTQQWTPAAVEHSALLPDSCMTCHDGVQASGKDPNHINTTDFCDSCHQRFPATWAPVANNAVDHTQVIGICSSCHNGTTASGKSANHINSTNTCDACHQPGPTPWTPVANASVDHGHVIGSCISCHDGTTASGKSPNHINSTNLCDACHQPGPTPWTPVANNAVDHNQVLGVCSSCHDNLTATGKGPGHVQTTLECDNCHITTDWTTITTIDHSGFVNNCISCHDGIAASGKSGNHINTSNNCDACHVVFPANWTPVANANVDHSQVIGTCISCHNGTTASGKSANHINTTDLCDACHQPGPTPWSPVANNAVDHNQVLGVCSSCHDNLTATGKGPGHVITTLECDNCHITGNWTTVTTVDHSGFVNNCISCHDGVTASGKSGSHINTSNNCDACHAVFPANWTPVANNSVDHNEVIGTCVSCHNGTTASGKSANHINTTDLCDACHQPGPTPWTPVANSAVDHNQVLGVCSSCHNNIDAQGKDAGHLQTTLECDNCHITGNWTTVTTVDHSGFVNNCISCHDGVTASGKDPNHINTSNTCDACHAVFPANWAPVAANSVDHNEVIGTCFSCHNGTTASGKSANHINSSNTCDACHQPGPTPWTNVPNSAVDHAHVLGTCISCHNGIVASGKSANHISTTDLCDACHQPGPTPWTPVPNSAVDHNQTLGVCSSCHNNIDAQGKDAGHLQTTLECDNCHITANWTTITTVDHSGFVNNCITCHDGVTASGKDGNHINTSNNCDACHAVFPANWAPVAANSVDHNEVIGTCFSCHNGTTASGKSPSHINSTNTCDACHQPGPTPWSPIQASAVDHGNVIGSCVSCHNNLIASGKPGNHPATTDLCDACHRPGPSPWLPFISPLDHNEVIGTCVSCHNNIIALGKPGNHPNTTDICEACHSVPPSSFANVITPLDHTQVIGTCVSCHNGVDATGKGGGHPTTTDLCEVCHDIPPTPWASFITPLDHSQVLGTCVSCHDGTTATGKSGNHPASTDVCENCHGVPPTPWTNVLLPFSHGDTSALCDTCHDGGIAQGKPGDHCEPAGQCDDCHITSSWTGGNPPDCATPPPPPPPPGIPPPPPPPPPPGIPPPPPPPPGLPPPAPPPPPIPPPAPPPPPVPPPPPPPPPMGGGMGGM